MGTLIKPSIYLGHSPYQAVPVALVMNPATDHVSPQFHVVFETSSTKLNLKGKEQYPPIGQILCNTAHKAAHWIISTSSKLGLLEILGKIPEKPNP